MKFRGTLLLLVLSTVLGGFYFLYQRPQIEERKAAEAFGKRFFRADASAISMIIVENRDGKVVVSHGAEGWMIEKPQRYRPDDGMIKKLLDTIATGQLTKVVGDRSELIQFGFDQPILSLTLGLGAKTEVLVVGRKNPTDTAYYAYSESLGKIFLVNKELPAELYLRLYDLREKRLYPELSPENIGKLIIARESGNLTLVQENGRWRLTAPAEADASTEEVGSFMQSLLDQKAVAFVPWGGRKHGAGQRRLQVFDRKGQVLLDNQIYYLGSGENEGVVIYTPGSAEATKARREFWELLQVEADRLLERRLFRIEREQIEKIFMVTGSERVELVRQGSQWRSAATKVDNDKVNPAIDALLNWKANSFDRSSTPIGETTVIIEMSKAGTTHRLVIGDRVANTVMSAAAPDKDGTIPDIKYYPAMASGMNRTVLVTSHEVNKIVGLLRSCR